MARALPIAARRTGVSLVALTAALAALACVTVAHAGTTDGSSGDSGASSPGASSSGASSSTGTSAAAPIAGTGGSTASSFGGISDIGAAPPFGSAVRLGNVGDLFNRISSGTTAAPPGQFLTIVPSIGASEQFATGNYGGYNNGGHEFITSINPGLLISGAAPRATFTLNYDPSIQFYSNQSPTARIDQSLDGALDAVLIPNSLTVQARAYATEQATSGGLAPGGSSVFANNNTTLTQSYSVTPQYTHKFEGLGTLDLTYSAQYTRQTGNSAYLPGANQPYFQNQDVFAQTEAGSFTTVPIDLRFDDTASASATEDIGTGVLNGAHQYFAQNTVRYAIIRHVVLSASGGYEDLSYAGIPPTRIRDATWSIGVRMEFPNQGQLVARYQHLYGFNAPYVVVSYPITRRTMLAGSYSEVLSTQQQGIGAGVASSTVNSVGLPVSSVGGLPVVLNNQSLGVQSGLTRTKQLSVALTTQFTRDTLSFAVLGDQEDLVATAPGLEGYSQKSISGSISETHQISERLAALFYVDYGRTTSPTLGAGTNSTYGASAALTYRYSSTLSFNAEYSLTNQNYGGVGNQTFSNGGADNIFTVGFQKTF